MALQTAQEAINAGLRSGGFAGELSGKMYVTFDLPPLMGVGWEELRDSYLDEVQEIDGVIYDEGQGDGYTFEVDTETYTIQSQKRLLAVIQKYRNRLAAQSVPA